MRKNTAKLIEFTITYKNEDNTQGMYKKVMCKNIDKAVEYAATNYQEGFFPESIEGTDGSVWF
jgi:hypothetical protein